MRTFGSEVAHLFEHLDNEIKDNQVFEKYEKNREKWEKWPENRAEWSLPTQYKEAKSLIYNLYKTVAEKGENGYDLPMNLTYSSHGDITDSIYNFNTTILGLF